MKYVLMLTLHFLIFSSSFAQEQKADPHTVDYYKKRSNLKKGFGKVIIVCGVLVLAGDVALASSSSGFVDLGDVAIVGFAGAMALLVSGGLLLSSSKKDAAKAARLSVGVIKLPAVDGPALSFRGMQPALTFRLGF